MANENIQCRRQLVQLLFLHCWLRQGGGREEEEGAFLNTIPILINYILPLTVLFNFSFFFLSILRIAMDGWGRWEGGVECKH